MPLLARRAGVAGDGLPKGARRAAGRSRREQAALGHDGSHQGEAAPAHRGEDREAVHDPAEGPPAARRNAAANRNGLLFRDSTLTDGNEKADISTLEKTGHLYFGPTPAGTGRTGRCEKGSDARPGSMRLVDTELLRGTGRKPANPRAMEPAQEALSARPGTPGPRASQAPVRASRRNESPRTARDRSPGGSACCRSGRRAAPVRRARRRRRRAGRSAG